MIEQSTPIGEPINNLADTLNSELHLQEVNYRELATDQFVQFVTRRPKSLVRTTDAGVYRFGEDTSITCEPTQCEVLESVVEQDMAAVLMLAITMSEQGRPSIQLVSVDCADDRSSFDEACL